MTIHIKLFASLSEQLGFNATELEVTGDITVLEIWKQITPLPAPANLLCAINQSYSDLGQSVKDGDEVAFFPPVNGG